MTNIDKQLKVYKASAGSGKTFRLTVEYIALLVKEPTEYQHILAVTFTNKATGEMKQRILSQLYGIANELASSQDYVDAIINLIHEEDGQLYSREEIKEKCAKALSFIIHDYSNFRIVTIDSFFQSIVRELANELGLSANINIELDADKILKKAVDEIIDNLSLQSPEYYSLVKYIESQIEDNKNWKIEQSVADFGKNLLSEKFLIHDNSVREKMTDKSQLEEFKKTILAFGKNRVEEINKKLHSHSQAALKAIDDNGIEKDLSSYPVKMLKLNWEETSKLTDTQYTYADDEEKWKKKNPKNASLRDSIITGTLLPHAASIVKLVEDKIKVENDVRASIANIYNLMIIGKIDEQMDALNKENNRFLLAETAHFLCDVINGSNLPFIYEKTGTVINHIMIDEFQDTSTLQWQNFKPLLTNSLDANQSCLIVGDVKQSIYRFRNSDWQVLNSIDKEDSDMFSYIKPIKQHTNFRSSPTIIDFNNKFFTEAIKNVNKSYEENHGHECEALTTAYKDVCQEPSDVENIYGYVKVENIAPEKENKNDKIDYNALELERVFENVKSLIEAGVEQKDIAILVRKGFEAANICEYFEKRKDELDVKVVSNEAFKLEASAAVQMIIFALRAISSQQDRLHLATLAYHYQIQVLGNPEITNNSSIPFLVKHEELAKKYLPKEFYENMSEMRFKSIAEIVEDVYSMFQLSKLKNQDAYMFFFQDIVKAYSTDNLADIDSFIARWDEELHEKSIPNGASDGIQLMTIHKSKGLEFHTVIIPFCKYDLAPKDSTLLWCSPTQEPYAEMPLLPVEYSKTKKSSVFVEDHDQEELLTLVDNINVMYVGFTRPVHNLVIITDNGGSANGANKFIIDAIEGAKANEKKPLQMSVEINSDTSLVTYEIGKIVPHKCPDIEKKTEPKDHKENPLKRDYDETSVGFVTNSSMAEFRQSNESDLFISNKLENENAQKHAEKIRLISLGNLYHNTLQLINTPKDIHKAIINMDQKGCFEQHESKEIVEDTITKLITSIEDKHPEWFSEEWKVINERAILFQDKKDGTMCMKRPDRVIVKDNKAIVIDYKTGQDAATLLSDGSISVPTNNENQVNQYCQFMRDLGYEEVEGYLWYILQDIIYKVQ